MRSTQDFHQVQLFSQQTKYRIDQHLRHGLDDFKITSFQSTDAIGKLRSELDFELGNDRWIEDDSHIFGTLNYRDVFKCIQFLIAHHPFQVHLDFEQVLLTDSEGHRIYNMIRMGDWWWDMF